MIDVLVPPGQAPGGYDGQLEVRGGGGFTQSIPVHVQVRGFGIPSTSTLESSFGLYPEICTAHYGKNCFRNRERVFALRSLYVRAALEDRVTLSDYAFPPPVPGDESRLFRRYALPLLQGRSPQDRGGLWSDVRLAGAELTSISVQEVRFIDDWKRAAKQGGFSDRVFFYACDEPSTRKDEWQRCKHRSRAAAAAWRDLPNLITAAIQTAERFGADRLIDILVPLVNDLDNKTDLPAIPASPATSVALTTSSSLARASASGSTLRAPATAAGPRTVRILTGGGWPSYVIDQPGSEQRQWDFSRSSTARPGSSTSIRPVS